MIRAVVAALLVVATVACGGSTARPRVLETPGPTAPPGGVVIRFGSHHLAAEVASTPNARARGLMFRESLGRDAGMIFLFPRPSRGGFWMKNTLIPLSIAFLTRTGPGAYRVLAILDMQPCRTPACPSYSPGTVYDAAVEVAAGWYLDRDIRRGTVARVVEGAEPQPS